MSTTFKHEDNGIEGRLNLQPKKESRSTLLVRLSLRCFPENQN
ncbi:MAG TPA: hypothetical protein VKZ44_08790 [Taishania sp.]|nr:hypothetical protein [Taishania sp.]